MRDWLKTNPDKAKEIEEKIRAAYKTSKEETEKTTGAVEE